MRHDWDVGARPTCSCRTAQFPAQDLEFECLVPPGRRAAEHSNGDFGHTPGRATHVCPLPLERLL
eukprot:365134-Chlamydomonas_euryale.AAC.3